MYPRVGEVNPSPCMAPRFSLRLLQKAPRVPPPGGVASRGPRRRSARKYKLRWSAGVEIGKNIVGGISLRRCEAWDGSTGPHPAGDRLNAAAEEVANRRSPDTALGPSILRSTHRAQRSMPSPRYLQRCEPCCLEPPIRTNGGTMESELRNALWRERDLAHKKYDQKSTSIATPSRLTQAR